MLGLVLPFDKRDTRSNITKKATNNNFIHIIKKYNNPLASKNKIYQDNKDKNLIYRWVNKHNNNSYIGSTVNAYSRFYRYFNVDKISNPRMPIYNALKKYGFNNFELEILEHCEKDNILEREQFYLDALKPEYNILKVAGSSLGFKHSEETLEFFKNERVASKETREKLSKAASNRILTSLERNKLSDVRRGTIMPEITRDKISKSITSKIGISVIVKDLVTGLEKTFDSLTKAANHIGVSRTAVKKCCDNRVLLKNRYQIKLNK